MLVVSCGIKWKFSSSACAVSPQLLEGAAGDTLGKRFSLFLNLDGTVLGLAFQKQRPVIRKGYARLVLLPTVDHHVQRHKIGGYLVPIGHRKPSVFPAHKPGVSLGLTGSSLGVLQTLRLGAYQPAILSDGDACLLLWDLFPILPQTGDPKSALIGDGQLVGQLLHGMVA